MADPETIAQRLDRAAAALAEARQAMKQYRAGLRNQDLDDLLFHWGRELTKLEDWLQRCARDVLIQSGKAPAP